MSDVICEGYEKAERIFTAMLTVSAITLLILVVQAISVNAWAELGSCTERKWYNITNTTSLDAEVIPMNHSLGQSELRFYLSDDSTEKAYWSENDSLAKITDTANSNGYMYYNCSTDESNGKAVFYLFDDFTAQNLTLWTEGDDVGYLNSYVEIQGGSVWDTYNIVSKETFEINKTLRASGYLNNATAISFIGFKGAGSGLERFQTSADNDIKYYSHSGSADTLSAAYGKDPRTERKFDINWLNETYCEFVVDDMSKTEATNIMPDALPVTLEAYSGYVRMDWVYVHNASSGQVISVSFGPEESAPPPPDVYDFTITLSSPEDATVNNSLTMDFAFSVDIQNTTLANCSLWTNESGWSDKEINTTAVQNGTNTYISETFAADGSYLWNIECWNDTAVKFASANHSFSIDTTGPPTADFVTPTLSNASYTNSADYIEINLSSDQTIGECIFQIDHHNYSMTTAGQYCYLNFTNLGYTGRPDLDISTLFTKHPSNVLVPSQSNEMSPFFMDGVMHTIWSNNAGFLRSNATEGVTFVHDNGGAAVMTANATNDEQDIWFSNGFHCTLPECEHKHYLFYVATNNSGTPAQPNELKVRWSDDYYLSEADWYQCPTPLATIKAGTWRSYILANPGVVFNGTGWLILQEGHDGSNFQIGAFSLDQVNPCATFSVLNGDSPVFPKGSFSGSASGTGNPWIDMYGDRYIAMPGGYETYWRAYLHNSTDGVTWTIMDTDPLLTPGPENYDNQQTADCHFTHAPNEFNQSMYYYGAVNASGGAIALASTNYSANEIWGAGIQDIGELEFTVHVKDSEGDWNSTSRTLNFDLDTSPPSIVVVAPLNTTTYTSVPINLNITTNEGAVWCGFNLGGGANTTMSGSGTTWYSQISPGSDGTYHLLVYCNDTTGNMGMNSSLWFTYSIADYSENYNIYTYETTEETFSIIFNLSNYDTISNVTAILNWNGTGYSGSSTGRNGDIMTINATVTVPDSTNETYVVSFNWNYTIYYIDESTESATAESHDQTVYALNISNCTSGDTFLYLLLKDEDGGGALTGDLEVDFYIDSMEGGYDTNKSFAFDIDGLSEFSFCFEPTSSTFYVDAIIIYNADGYSQRTHYLEDAALSSSAQNISLFLASNTTTTLVTMGVLDNAGLPVEGVQINIQRYYVGSGTYETIDISETDFQGEAYTYLILNTVWYRFILIQDGVVLEQYSPMIITEDEITFRLSAGELGEWFQYYDNIAFNCTWPGNTTTCTVTDTSGLMVFSELSVKRWTSLGYIDVCSMSSSSSSSTLVCPMGVLTGRLFWYELTAEFASTEAVLDSGFRDHRVQPGYGMVGVMAALMLMLVMVFMGIYRWEISLAFCAASVGISSMMGILIVAYSSVVAGFVVVGVAIYKTRSS